MDSQMSKVKQLIDNAERIGVIGSPSSTSELSLDILAQAVNKKLVGELALFCYQQDGSEHYALGQITEVALRNVWHEDPTMRSLIRQRGQVDAVSGRQDTHLGEMIVSAVFCNTAKGYRPSLLGTVPATGTTIHLVDDHVLNEILLPYKEHLFYLGHVYGSTPQLPMWFKHFDSGPNGAGEAYHIGVFGKTGSGKSVLAKMILLAYARYKNMGLLVIDPQGEFAKEARGETVPGEFRLPTKDILTKKLNRNLKVFGVRDLVLDRWELFAQILYESSFFEQLSIPHGENRQLACNTLAGRLQKSHMTLSKLHERASFDKAWELLGTEQVQKIFYRSEGSRDRFQSVYNESDRDQFYQQYWRPIAELFRQDRAGAQQVEKILNDLFNLEQGQRPIIIVDLSAEQQASAGQQANLLLPGLEGEPASGNKDTSIFWNETIQALVIKRLLDGIRYSAEQSYQQNRSLNTLVLIDEAHRLAPRENPENEELKSVRDTFIDAVRTTRKQGLGWMFISQTLSSLHREIIGQLRIFFLGFGLGMGMELQALSELVGARSKALDLYKLFRDPHSSFDTASREYSFMTIGPVSPLSFAGTPLFFNAFNTPEMFLDVNHLMR